MKLLYTYKNSWHLLQLFVTTVIFTYSIIMQTLTVLARWQEIMQYSFIVQKKKDT